MPEYRFSRGLVMAATALLFFISAAAQQELPRYMTPEEEQRWPDYLRQKREEAMRSVPSPPPGRVRTMAEWEEIQALVLTWTGGFNTIQREIVRHAVKECKVLILTRNAGEVSGILTGAGIALDSVELIEEPFNSIWVRDFGPWAVYHNDVDSLWLTDWIYNRPRPLDDLVPGVIAERLGLPVFEATAAPYNWVHTGGNNLPDGMASTFSSMLVLEENPSKTEDEIDTISKIFLGTTPYIKFPTLPYDGIHHLDMHMRIIDEETIFFGEYPEGVSDGPQIESNINYLLDEHKTAFGRDYNIIRLPMPPDQNGRYPSNGGSYRTYTNSVFLNKTVLVPTYEERYDTTALRIYRENLPGYNVVGINCNAIIPSLGAIHCITKTVGVSDPLWIAHPRVRDSEDPSQSYPVTAIIKHRSGIAGATLYYRTAGDEAYASVAMTLTDGVEQVWTAVIPPFPSGTEVQYYIYATANSGKQQVRPIVAPEGYFRFHIRGEAENVPPSVAILSPADGSVFDLSEDHVLIEFDASDIDGAIISAVIYINGEAMATLDTLPYQFEWGITGEGDFSVTIEVTDDRGGVALSDAVMFSVQSTTSQHTILVTDDLVIYPNPAADKVWVKGVKEEPATTAIRGMVWIEVSDLTGRVLRRERVTAPGLISIDLSGLSPGLYFLKMDDGGSVSGGKVVKL